MAVPRRQPRAARRNVALLIETSNGYSRALLRGIRDYLRQHTDWAIHLTEQGRGNAPPAWFPRQSWDGVIARIETPRIEAAVRSLRAPAVNVSAAGLAGEYPTVITDSQAVTRLVAGHFIERGFTQFAYCGDGRFAWSESHRRNLEEHLRLAGHACAVYDSRPGDFADVRGERAKLARWLKQLPKPVGIMACYDIRGQQVLEVCRQLGLHVPDEVAVIGVHNDDLLCELCDPPLSSVIPNARRAGYQAAALLDRMMRGRAVPAAVHWIEPLGIAVRQSTDVVALGDPRLAAAVRFIREHACRGITVDDVLHEVPLSRTLLERGFRQRIGRAPHEYIAEIRMRKARELLAGGDLPIATIAGRCGFFSPEYFSAAFKLSEGVSPRKYRTSAGGAHAQPGNPVLSTALLRLPLPRRIEAMPDTQ